MCGHPPTRGRVLGHHQRRHDSPRLPAELSGDVTRESYLDVDRAEQSLDIGDDRLDLNDQQRSGRGMERQEVDAPTLAISAESDLDTHDPTGKLKLCLEQGLKRRVTGIQQTVQLAAARSAVDIQVDVERLADPTQGANGESGWSFAFQL